MDPTPVVRTGWKRVALVTLGLALVGLGYLGVLLPGLPATPFLIGASYCFIRSSPRLHGWLRRSPVLGSLLHDWEVHRGIRRPVKGLAICLVVTAVTASIVFGGLPVWAKVAIGCLAAVGITVIVWVPTVTGFAPSPPASGGEGWGEGGSACWDEGRPSDPASPNPPHPNPLPPKRGERE